MSEATGKLIFFLLASDVMGLCLYLLYWIFGAFVINLFELIEFKIMLDWLGTVIVVVFKLLFKTKVFVLLSDCLCLPLSFSILKLSMLYLPYTVLTLLLGISDYPLLRRFYDWSVVTNSG